MVWSPPAGWAETQGQLSKTGSVTLDANGNGVIIFDPDSARERWVVSSVVVSDNQTATAITVPVATVALNTTQFATMSQGNQRGASWSGNIDTFQGSVNVGPCDFFSVLFTPPAGSTPAQISSLTGTICTAIVTGVKLTRREVNG